MIRPCGAGLAGSGEKGLGERASISVSAAGVKGPVSLARGSVKFEELLESLGGQGSATRGWKSGWRFESFLCHPPRRGDVMS